MPVLDETGFVKKGLRSVGVQRQYAGRHGHALIDRALHLPQSWAGDGERRRLAWVPEAVAFASKPKLGGDVYLTGCGKTGRCGALASAEA